ncbi:HigA family addiction module antitoxin [Endozoicomonas sp. 4G]|uniref:HigA family addiction module antitoxin n=1 Tax=Endozoicomonas sp. 4G TaxID=2872754 RepID=UPI0020787C83|nr:HigA family addiction module antitoxin [Endozoicomonas sp. 4G]
MRIHDPLHPGEFIRQTYMEPANISCRRLSEALEVSPSTLNRVLQGKSAVSTEMARRLSKVLGRTTESWLIMQHNYDIWQSEQSVTLDTLKPFKFSFA